MGVAPGSPVSAGNTNSAFIDQNADDTGVGIYNWQNTNAISGPFVLNHQREINSLNSYSGRVSGSVYNAKPTWVDTNAGTNTDSLTQRAEALTVKMNPSTGHTHDGNAGNGPQISAPNLANVNLIGYVQQGLDITAGGVSGYTDTSNSGNSGVGLGIMGGTNERQGQTFIPTVAGPFGKVTFKLRKGISGTISGNLVVKLYTDSAGQPGTLLDTSSTFDVSTLTTTAALTDFIFSATANVSLATTYHLDIDTSGITFSGGGQLIAIQNSSNPYANGYNEFSTDSGATWAAVGANYDLIFFAYIAIVGGSSSTDVTSQMSAKTPSTNSTNIGVVVNAPYNKDILTQSSGPNEGDKITDGSGHIVYGRLTFSSGTWTLSYYVDIGGTETPYSFSTSTGIRWYYQEIFNPLSGTNPPPVYNALFFTPSDNATADVVDASPTTRGLVNTATQSFAGNKTFTGNVIIQGATTLATSLTGVLRAAAGVISTGLVNLASEVSGILPIANGGTGASNRTDALDNVAPATPAKGDLLVYNSVTGHWVRFPAGSDGDTIVYDSTLATGLKTGPGVVYRAGSQSLTSGDTNKTITFSSAFASTNYRVSVVMRNTTDTFPAFIPMTIIAKTTTSFQVSWNNQVDSSNYAIEYIAIGDL